MKWGKVFQKFFGGLIAGGVGTAVTTVASAGDPDTAKAGALVSVIVGFITGIMNWYKHKND